MRSSFSGNESNVRKKKYLEERGTIFETKTVGKLSNFLTLSENAKQRALTAKERQKAGGAKTARASRKSSILGSLDKFLNDDDYDEETIATESVTRSSFSSDVLSLDSASFANSVSGSGYCQLLTCTSLTKVGRPESSTVEKQQQQPSTRRRAARRGSVTKYSLGTIPTRSLQSDDESHHADKSNRGDKCRSEEQETTASKHKTHDNMNRNSSGTRTEHKKVHCNSLRHSSTREDSFMATQKTLDEDDGSCIFTIDQMPIPMHSAGNRKSSVSHLSEDEDDDLSTVLSSPIKPTHEHRRSSISITSVYGSNASSIGSDETEADNSFVSFGGLHSPRKKSASKQNSHSNQRSPFKGRRFQRRGSTMKASIPDEDFASTGRTTAAAAADIEGDSNSLPPRPRRTSIGNATSATNTFVQDKNGKRRSLGGMLASLSRQSSLSTLNSKQNENHNDDQQSYASQRSEGGNSAESRRRYQRRGSVTKYSLNETLTNIDDPIRNCDVVQQDERNTLSEQLPPFAPTTSRRSSQSNGRFSQCRSEEERTTHSGQPQPRYQRRGSVTKYNI